MTRYYIAEEYGESILIECENYKDFNKVYYELINEGENWKKKLGLSFNPFEVSEVNKRIIKFRAKGVTGFLKLGSRYIEITPKFLKYSKGDSWRTALTHILMLTGQNHLFDENHTSARESRNYLADLIAEVFYYSLKNGIERGLPRSYKEERDKLKYFKGKLDISRISEIFVNKETIPCIYEEYTEDFVINRLLKWAALELSNKVFSPKTSYNLVEIASNMTQVSTVKPTIIEVDSIELSPEYSYLNEAINIATLLIKTISLEHGMGKYGLKGFLWNSHTVFEKFMKIIIKKVCIRNKYWNFCDNPIVLCTGRNGTSDIETSPDIRIIESDKVKFLLDAKYKIWKRHPKNGDIYQVMAGGRVVDCTLSGLIYPKTRDDQDFKLWDIAGKGNPQKLAAIFVDITAIAQKNGMDFIIQKMQQDLEKLERS